MSEFSTDESQPDPDRENRRAGRYERIVASLTGQEMPEVPLSHILRDTDRGIVFIEDHHGITPLDNILSFSEAKQLKMLGFTHYLCEGRADTQPLLDMLNAHNPVDLAGVLGLIPGLSPTLNPAILHQRKALYANAIYNMAGGELEVRAIDHPEKGAVSAEEREQFIFQQIKAIRDGGGRPIISMGISHAQPGNINGAPSTVQRLLNDEEDVLSISYRSPNRQRTVPMKWEKLSRPEAGPPLRTRIKTMARRFIKKS